MWLKYIGAIRSSIVVCVEQGVVACRQMRATMHRRATVQSYVFMRGWNSIKVTKVAYRLQGADGMICKHRRMLSATQVGLHV